MSELQYDRGRGVDTETGILGWVLAGVSTIIASLSGVVTYLFKKIVDDYKANEIELKLEIGELKKRADSCEDDREALRIKQALLEARVESLEQQIKGTA